MTIRTAYEAAYNAFVKTQPDLDALGVRKDWCAALLAVGVEPSGPADQVQRLRDLVAGLERGQLDCQAALAEAEREEAALRERLEKAEQAATHWEVLWKDGGIEYDKLERDRDRLAGQLDKSEAARAKCLADLDNAKKDEAISEANNLRRQLDVLHAFLIGDQPKITPTASDHPAVKSTLATVERLRYVDRELHRALCERTEYAQDLGKARDTVRSLKDELAGCREQVSNYQTAQAARCKQVERERDEWIKRAEGLHRDFLIEREAAETRNTQLVEAKSAFEEQRAENQRLRTSADRERERALRAEARAVELEDVRYHMQKARDNAEKDVSSLRRRVAELEERVEHLKRDKQTARAGREALLEVIEGAEKAYCIEGDYSGEDHPFVLAMRRMHADVGSVARQRDKALVRAEAAEQHRDAYETLRKQEEKRRDEWRTKYETLLANGRPKKEAVIWAKRVHADMPQDPEHAWAASCFVLDMAEAANGYHDQDEGRPRDEWWDKYNELKGKYETLLAKATVPDVVMSWASAVTVGPGAMRDAARAAERFLLALHAATKSEPPKRKTREEIVADVLQNVPAEANAISIATNIIAALDFAVK